VGKPRKIVTVTGRLCGLSARSVSVLCPHASGGTASDYVLQIDIV